MSINIDFLDPITINLISSYIYDTGKKFFTSKNYDVKFSDKDISLAINSHITEVLKWSEEIKHKGMNNRSTTKSYIHLKYSEVKRNQFDGYGAEDLGINLKSQLETTAYNTVILGQPGAGKTTSSKFIAIKILEDPDFCAARYQIPIVIRFSELKKYSKDQRSNSENFEILGDTYRGFSDYNEGIFEKLFSIFGLKGLNQIPEFEKSTFENLIIDIIGQQKIFLILDGLDEYRFNNKASLIEEVRRLSLKLNTPSFLLTSRTAEFPYTIENTEVFEIAPLANEQIIVFANNWLEDQTAAADFLSQLKKSTYYETARRPLFLSYLLTIYNKRSPRTIPNKPNAIYSKVVELLIREWDEERNVVRQSKYASFQYERKKAFLIKLAYNLTKKQYGTTFTFNTIRSEYLDICESFELPKDESFLMITELESHNGLFLKSGNNRYEFAHKVIKEYLTAEYLKGIPKLTRKKLPLNSMPDELAILIALATEPNDYLDNIVQLILSSEINLDFIHPFINRLILENPDFSSSFDLGVTILTLFSYVFKNMIDSKSKEDTLTIISNLILTNSKFVESCYFLETAYQLSASDGKKTVDASRDLTMVFTYDAVVEITPLRNKELPNLLTRLVYLQRWKNIEPTFRVRGYRIIYPPSS